MKVRMKIPKLTRKHWLLLVAALVMLLLVVGSIIKKRAATSDDSAQQVKRAVAMEFLPSDIVEVKQGDLRKILPVSGSLLAVKKVVIKAKVSADVQQVLVREGEAVKVGQVLIRMDASEYQARLDQAKGAWQAAQAQLDIATQKRNNNKALLEKNFISKNAFDNAQSQYSIAVSNVKSAKGVFDVAQKATRDTVIRTPISGYVSARSVEPGEKVSTDNKLLEIVDLRQMEMEAAVPASDIVNVVSGQEVQLRVEGIPEVIAGKVARINPSIQVGSRSILVYIQIENKQELLRAGMFAEGKLTLTKREKVLSVPGTAIRTVRGKPSVYVVENGKLIQKSITLGIRGDSGQQKAVEVKSGLSKGDKIVKANLGNLQEGTPVRIAKQVGAAKSGK